ncbi:MAG: hypothetical protein AAF211_12360 [Myxococcota bacterium]
MDRTLAEFADGKTATKAVEQLIASSFDMADMELFAVPEEGASVRVPIRHRSEFGRGFLLGGLLSFPLGVFFVVQLGVESSPSLGLLVVGLGCALGATLGVGWWSVSADRSAIPEGSHRLVLAVRGPPPRLAHAQSVMQEAGGSDATPRDTAPAQGPRAQ